MFGQVTYQQGNYQELLLADEEHTRLILCVEGSSIRLYRIEWTDKEGYNLSSVQYTLIDSIKAFREAIELQGEETREQNDTVTVIGTMVSHSTPLPEDYLPGLQLIEQEETPLSQEELLREYEAQESYESRATYNPLLYGKVPFDHNFRDEI